MGKVHRIKKHFWRVVNQQRDIQVGHVTNYCLAHTRAEIYIGKRYDGSIYVGHYSSQRSYDKLLDQLIKAYESGGSSSD